MSPPSLENLSLRGGDPGRRSRVLVVDDEYSIRDTFTLLLEEAGYRALAVADPAEALSALSDGGVDVAFVDILLEHTSGIDLMEEMKRRSPSTEVVIVTGAPSVETAAEALRLGAFDYLVKPVGQEALLQAADFALRHKVVVEAVERYRLNLGAIFQSLEDGIVTVDDRLETVEVNPATERLCGIRREDLLGRRFDRASLQCSGRCLELLERSVAGGPPIILRHLECCARHRPDQVVDVRATPLVRGSDGPSGGVMVIRDQTRVQDLEQSLHRHRPRDLVGHSSAIRHIRSTIESLNELPETVLVTGESGAGKEVVAWALHVASRRRPLLKVDCSALSEGLLEVELFGRGEGPPGGHPETRRPGSLELARGGTLLVTEIADLTLRLQERLSRVLDTSEIEGAGGEPIPVDVRMIATTSRDLGERVASGLFSEALHGRLRSFAMHVPPLRERREDVPSLVRQLLERLNARLAKRVTRVSDSVLELFLRHPWPGNVRELERVLEHAFVVADGESVTLGDLPAELRAGAGIPAAAVVGGEGAAR